MPAQVQHGSLLQFADDTCLICSGNSNEDTSRLLTENLTSLSQWIAASRMQVNVNKSTNIEASHMSVANAGKQLISPFIAEINPYSSF